jgi:hypothetical protein
LIVTFVYADDVGKETKQKKRFVVKIVNLISIHAWSALRAKTLILVVQWTIQKSMGHQTTVLMKGILRIRVEEPLELGTTIFNCHPLDLCTSVHVYRIINIVADILTHHRFPHRKFATFVLQASGWWSGNETHC